MAFFRKLSKKIEYVSLGDSNRIGASAHYLRFGDWGILLDAGIDPDSSGEAGLPDFDFIREFPVNAIIISHAHLDHLGSLPVALQYFPQARVYMTPATVALSEKLLYHYLKVRTRRAAEIKVKNKPLFTAEQLDKLLYLFQSFDYNFPFKIHGFQESEIEIDFWDAGHILGSAGIEINWRGRRIFYTGNTKKSSQFILRGAKYPQEVDILISETTYGADEKAPLIKKAKEVKRFVAFLKNRLKLGGVVLIPVFALGRTQEILMLLHRLIQKNKLPVVPIYITGLGNAINQIYDRLLRRTYPDYDIKRLQTITSDSLRGKHFRKPSILLATSGMMIPDTLSYEIASDFLQKPRNGIAFVGWADPELPGGALRELNMEKIRRVFGTEQILCKIDVFHFTAHSHREELLAMMKQMKPCKIILCHGETAALDWMENAIRKNDSGPEIIRPESSKLIKI